MTENRPWQSAEPSLLRHGRQRDAVHGPQSGSGDFLEQSICAEQCQSSVKTRVLPVDSFNVITR